MDYESANPTTLLVDHAHNIIKSMLCLQSMIIAHIAPLGQSEGGERASEIERERENVGGFVYRNRQRL